MLREIRQFRSWNTLPRARKLKPKFEFQNILAWNSPSSTLELKTFGANLYLCWNCPTGTSELLPFGANSDLTWNWRFPYIPSWGFLFAFPRWGLLCFPFVGNYIFPRWGFTMLLLSWGTTYILQNDLIPHMNHYFIYKLCTLLRIYLSGYLALNIAINSSTPYHASNLWVNPFSLKYPTNYGLRIIISEPSIGKTKSITIGNTGIFWLGNMVTEHTMNITRKNPNTPHS